MTQKPKLAIQPLSEGRENPDLNADLSSFPFLRSSLTHLPTNQQLSFPIANPVGDRKKSKASSNVQIEIGAEEHLETVELPFSNIQEMALEIEVVIGVSETEEVAFGVDAAQLTERFESETQRGESISLGSFPLSKVFKQSILGPIIIFF
ncbi:hypothetical protein Nepgr_001664 [Nepenthes gracilis]|uniref:Uncharacterized protein n=1 Tax=Nepenthes gracilis TaxID=150966 RepID=A0AAD3RXW9_NEPGR|nr:hypothetical protein Nepgr_001664 [Nepenthes gracilis]